MGNTKLIAQDIHHNGVYLEFVRTAL